MGKRKRLFIIYLRSRRRWFVFLFAYVVHNSRPNLIYAIYHCLNVEFLLFLLLWATWCKHWKIAKLTGHVSWMEKKILKRYLARLFRYFQLRTAWKRVMMAQFNQLVRQYSLMNANHSERLHNNPIAYRF